MGFVKHPNAFKMPRKKAIYSEIFSFIIISLFAIKTTEKIIKANRNSGNKTYLKNKILGDNVNKRIIEN